MTTEFLSTLQQTREIEEFMANLQRGGLAANDAIAEVLEEASAFREDLSSLIGKISKFEHLKYSIFFPLFVK